jgi:hypothetical protein
MILISRFNEKSSEEKYMNKKSIVIMGYMSAVGATVTMRADIFTSKVEKNKICVHCFKTGVYEAKTLNTRPLCRCAIDKKDFPLNKVNDYCK